MIAAVAKQQRRRQRDKSRFIWRLGDLDAQPDLRLAGGPGSGFHGHAGRPGKVGGSAPSGAAKHFADAPLTGKGAAAWRKKAQAAYDNDKDFKTVADAITLYTQGSFREIWGAAMAAEGHGDQLGAGNVADMLRDEPDLPLATAANPFASYKNFFERQDVANAKDVSMREAATALNRAIDESAVLDVPIFRGQYLGESRPIHYEGPFDPEKPMYEANPAFSALQSLKAGDEFPEFAGPTSFTSERKVAEQFALGTNTGQRARGIDDYTSAVVLEVRGAKGLKVSALSPWRQSEVISRGRFRVVSAEKTPRVKSSYGGEPRSWFFNIVLEAIR